MLHPPEKVALINGSRPFRPFLQSLAMLFIVLPIALKSGAVSMLVESFAVGLKIDPFADVVAPVCVDQSSKALCLVLLPVTFVLGAIFPK